MILSNVEIHKALDEGRLILDPEPAPRMPEGAGVDCPYQTSAIDLRLGDEISYFREDLPLNIDLRGRRFRETVWLQFHSPDDHRRAAVRT